MNSSVLRFTAVRGTQVKLALMSRKNAWTLAALAVFKIQTQGRMTVWMASHHSSARSITAALGRLAQLARRLIAVRVLERVALKAFVFLPLLKAAKWRREFGLA